MKTKQQTPTEYLKDHYGLDPNDLDLPDGFTIEDVERAAQKYDLNDRSEFMIEDSPVIPPHYERKIGEEVVDFSKYEVPNTKYNEDSSLLEEGKMYLGLFHGRHRPDEELDDWGFNGPVIGPLSWVHTTYKEHVRFCPVNEDDGIDLHFTEDMLKWNGKFYGDWSIFLYQKVKEPGQWEIVEAILPATWASFLVNRDYSGLSKQDLIECLTELRHLGLVADNCLSVSDDSNPDKFGGMLREIATYKFRK